MVARRGRHCSRRVHYIKCTACAARAHRSDVGGTNPCPRKEAGAPSRQGPADPPEGKALQLRR
eukprot:5132394-Alexandrium_andersonii.AAC.1